MSRGNGAEARVLNLGQRGGNLAQCAHGWQAGVGWRCLSKLPALGQLESRPDLLDIHRPARVTIGEAGINRLAHLEPVHLVVPGGILGQFIYQAMRFLFYALSFHTTISRRPGI